MLNGTSESSTSRSTDAKGTQVLLPCLPVVTVSREAAPPGGRPVSDNNVVASVCSCENGSLGYYRLHVDMLEQRPRWSSAARESLEEQVCTGGHICTQERNWSNENTNRNRKKKFEEQQPEIDVKPAKRRNVKTTIPTISVFTVSAFVMAKLLDIQPTALQSSNIELDHSDFSRCRRDLLQRVYLSNSIFRDAFLSPRMHNPAQREGIFAVSRPAMYRRSHYNLSLRGMNGRRNRRLSDISSLATRNNISPAATFRDDVRDSLRRSGYQAVFIDNGNFSLNAMPSNRNSEIVEVANSSRMDVASLKRKRSDDFDNSEEVKLAPDMPSTSASAVVKDCHLQNEVAANSNMSLVRYHPADSDTSSKHQELVHFGTSFKEACDYYVNIISVKRRKVDPEDREDNTEDADSSVNLFQPIGSSSSDGRQNINKFFLKTVNNQQVMYVHKNGDPPFFSW